MSKAQREKRKRYGQSLYVPIHRTEQGPLSPKAVGAHHQLNNREVTRKNNNPRGTRYTTYTRGGGIDTETSTSFHPRTGVHGERVHDVAFDLTKNRKPGGTEFQVPTIPDESEAGGKLRRQKMKVAVEKKM